MSFGADIRVGRQEEPTTEKVGFRAVAKKKRPALVGGVAGSAAILAVGAGTALANWGGATVASAVAGAASGAAGMTATHAAASAADGPAGGGSATVDDVAAAVRGVVKRVQDGAANPATDVKTRLEAALARILAAIPESGADASAGIEQVLLAAIREADEVRRHCNGAIERAESWANGL